MDDSGSLVVYATGTYGVSYDTIEGIVGSKVGDKVELCLVSLPEDCPAGDEREDEPGHFFDTVFLIDSNTLGTAMVFALLMMKLGSAPPGLVYT